MKSADFLKFLMLTCVSSIIAAPAAALPFNQDMVDVLIRPGSMARAPVEGSLPMGAGSYYSPVSKEAAVGLSNPLKGNLASAARGRRLYETNCYPCHGDFGKVPYQPGPVGLKTMLKMGEVAIPFQPPDLGAELYRDTPDGRSDGFLYGTIHWGGAVMMPALGWKLSDREHWDIVNFIRQVQQQRN